MPQNSGTDMWLHLNNVWTDVTFDSQDMAPMALRNKSAMF